MKVQQALQALCDELVSLDPDTDSEWLDEENLRIDTCIGEAKDYLERRKDDPPSTEGLAESWVRKHAIDSETIPATESLEEEVGAMSNAFAGMRTNVRQSQYKEVSHHQTTQSYVSS